MPAGSSVDKTALKAKVDRFYDAVDKAIEKLETLTSDTVNSKDFQEKATAICDEWHNEIYPALKTFGVSAEELLQYETAFEKLKALATSDTQAHRKNKYKKAFDLVRAICQGLLNRISYSRELKQDSYLSKIIEELETSEKDSIELSFLKEAVACADKSIRASLIMAWCASIARIHRVIERGGFVAFNQASQSAASIGTTKKGRFGRLGGRTYTCASSKELTEVNDSDLILIAEAMDLYDVTASKLMDFCLELRNKSAHPTAFSATPKHLEIFARGIELAVFKNSKMKIIVSP